MENKTRLEELKARLSALIDEVKPEEAETLREQMKAGTADDAEVDKKIEVMKAHLQEMKDLKREIAELEKKEN